MLSKQGDALQYLLDVRDGKIKQGLGLDCFLDEHLRFKPKQLNIILGHDNVGKTYWINWYFLSLALKHNLTFCIWSGENQKGQILRDMIQMYRGKHFSKLSHSQISGDLAYLEQSFTFIDNSKLYKPDEILELFKQSGADVGLIDPFTGLDREMSFAGNYEFMNRARQFVNQTGMTIYINTHPNSESGRTGNLYQDGEWKGHLKPPLKDHIEGGKAFLNRCDDMFVIHRLIKHETMKLITWVGVEKVKDTETGGKHTALNEPVYCNFNSGIGFQINGVDPLTEFRPKEFQTTLESAKDVISTSEKLRRLSQQNPF
jgi:hypothetical protein